MFLSLDAIVWRIARRFRNAIERQYSARFVKLGQQSCDKAVTFARSAHQNDSAEAGWGRWRARDGPVCLVLPAQSPLPSGLSELQNSLSFAFDKRAVMLS